MNYKEFFPIEEYYERYVVPLDKKYRVSSSGKMVCPLHNDHDPSLGVVNSSDGELFHCFGCNRWGDIVDLHIGVNRRLLKKYLSREEAIKDLCRIFSVDYNKLPKEVSIEGLDKEIRQEVKLTESLDKFDLSDFKEKLLEGKRQRKGIDYFNTLIMVMISETRKGK